MKTIETKTKNKILKIQYRSNVDSLWKKCINGCESLLDVYYL